MKPSRYEVELVTPCFLGGASGAAEWRAASIRGQLRWWFRALAGAACAGSLEAARQAETAIFGSTERASALRVRAWPPTVPPAGAQQPFPGGRKMSSAQLAARAGVAADSATLTRLRLAGNDVANPVHYLAYGPVVQGTAERSFFGAGATARFELLWLPGTAAGADRQLFSRALWAWLACGGIGSRSRRGLGSLGLAPAQVRNGTPAPPAANGPAPSAPGTTARPAPDGVSGVFDAAGPTTLEALRRGARELLALGRTYAQLPRWTHFSSGSRILVARQPEASWDAALEALGSWMVVFRRRYGAPTDARVTPDGPLRDRDYAWAAPGGARHREAVPDRAGFGLPLPFNPKAGGETVIWRRTGPGSPAAGDARRASPLLLHVSHFGDRFYPVLTYLPAALLPADAEPSFKREAQPPSRPVTRRQLGIVGRFLDELVDRGLVEEVEP
jgi:CRISPR-associated protein Cmr1